MLNTRAIVRAERATLVLLAVSDVTDARQAETLRVDAETLRLVDKRKDEFLGIPAHELRNPLAPMPSRRRDSRHRHAGTERLRRSEGTSGEGGNFLRRTGGAIWLGTAEDKARAAQAGFDRHFTKPVDVNSLRAFLAATGDALAE